MKFCFKIAVSEEFGFEESGSSENSSENASGTTSIFITGSVLAPWDFKAVSKRAVKEGVPVRGRAGFIWCL